MVAVRVVSAQPGEKRQILYSLKNSTIREVQVISVNYLDNECFWLNDVRVTATLTLWHPGTKNNWRHLTVLRRHHRGTGGGSSFTGGGGASGLVVLDHGRRLYAKIIGLGQSCAFIHPTPHQKRVVFYTLLKSFWVTRSLHNSSERLRGYQRNAHLCSFHIGLPCFLGSSFWSGCLSGA